MLKKDRIGNNSMILNLTYLNKENLENLDPLTTNKLTSATNASNP